MSSLSVGGHCEIGGSIHLDNISFQSPRETTDEHSRVDARDIYIYIDGRGAEAKSRLSRNNVCQWWTGACPLDF